jgi:hypothetical protein
MKSILALTLTVFLFASCASKVDVEKGKKLTSDYLTDLKNENYNDVNNYYTASFNESEPLEKKMEKFNKLKEVTGPIQSFELISTKENYDSVKGTNELELKYRVKCARLIVIETFLVIKDEGDEKIIFQNIENEK